MDSQPFSQEFYPSQMSQMSTQMPQMPPPSADSTYFSGGGDSQSQSQSLFPQSQQFYSSQDQAVPSMPTNMSIASTTGMNISLPTAAMPPSTAAAPLPSAPPPAKKSKYNPPKWTKGLLKTSEEAAKLRDYDGMVRRQEVENRDLKVQLMEIGQRIVQLPYVLTKPIASQMESLSKQMAELQSAIKKNYEAIAECKEKMETAKCSTQAATTNLKKEDLEESVLAMLASLAELKNMITEENEERKCDCVCKGKIGDILTEISGLCTAFRALKEEIKCGLDVDLTKSPKVAGILNADTMTTFVTSTPIGKRKSQNLKKEASKVSQISTSSKRKRLVSEEEMMKTDLFDGFDLFD